MGTYIFQEAYEKIQEVIKQREAEEKDRRLLATQTARCPEPRPSKKSSNQD